MNGGATFKFVDSQRQVLLEIVHDVKNQPCNRERCRRQIQRSIHSNAGRINMEQNLYPASLFPIFHQALS